ncbi:MAG TPA: hypothetical protein VKA27_04560 [Sunxiuqinia sp.]|nr:hypothetical protein [Sunxiuqinia sp.]
MKKLVILSMMLTFMLPFATVKAASVKEHELKSEIKTTREDLRLERKELNSLKDRGVSEITKDNFYKDFGNIANVTWEQNGPLAVATYQKGGKQVKSFFDFNNKLVGTSSVKTFAAIPKSAQRTIRKDYGKYEVGPVIFFKDNENNSSDMMLWNTPFASADNYFVELQKPHDDIIVQVNPDGNVSFFKQL